MNTLKKIGFFSAFIIPALVIAGFYLGGAWNALTLGFVFVFIPVVDFMVGRDAENLSNEKKALISNAFYYRFVTYLWTYIQLGLILFGAYVVTQYSLKGWEWALFLLSMSMATGGIGITVAHELGHKKSKLERFYSKLLLMTVCYMHFYVEHNRGHHVRVATPEDPATARREENFYAFWWRSVTKGWQSAWELEKKSLERKGHSTWSLHNQMIGFTLLPIIFCGLLMTAAFLYFGQWYWQIPVFFFGQSFLAFTLLEIVNYIEHYGLVRRKVDEHRYERVRPVHSWNANQMVSNFFLFQLQRHSDHHFNAIKRYQVLDHYEESPQLPAGYPTMLMVAIIPPLWFRIIHPILDRWRAQAEAMPAAA